MKRSYTSKDGSILEFDTVDPLTPEDVEEIVSDLTEGVPDAPEETEEEKKFLKDFYATGADQLKKKNEEVTQ